jgi:hypothetical protein
MKKILALAAALLATSAYANVDNSPHDLAGSAGAGVCQFCHIPHRANPVGNGLAPIWARTIASAGLTAYTSARFTANLDSTRRSLLCMSCHDGVTTLNALWTGATLPLGAGVALDANTNFGQDLRDDHPVGVVYPSAGTGATTSGLIARATATGYGFVLYGTGADTLECGSCHEPHTHSTDPSNANYKFKRTQNSPRDFCSSCHSTK